MVNNVGYNYAVGHLSHFYVLCPAPKYFVLFYLYIVHWELDSIFKYPIPFQP